MNGLGVCNILTSILAIYIVVIAFQMIFDQKKGGLNDLQVIQKQLKGFAVLQLSPLILMASGLVCATTLTLFKQK